MDFKLKLKSRKLESGKYQVKFSTEGFRSAYCGYLLTEPRTSLREVVEAIQQHLGAIQDTNRYFEPKLSSIGRRDIVPGQVLLFSSTDGQILSQNQLHYAAQ